MKKDNLVQIMDVPYVDIGMHTFEGEITEVSKNVLALKKSLRDEIKRQESFGNQITPFNRYKKIEIKIIYGYGEDDNTFGIVAYREMTPEEIKAHQNKMRARKAAEAKIRKENTLKKEMRERNLLEQLKKKYEQK